jgi:hypothetical protein
MPDATTLVILVYGALSLLIGGVAATVEIWTPPTMLDRADGRGKFPSPKVSAIGIGLLVALFWPGLVVVATIDYRKAEKARRAKVLEAQAKLEQTRKSAETDNGPDEREQR